jgi:hypothetical protein
MEGIYEPNSQFNFENIHLLSPTVMSGGNYFIKMLMKDTPLYIQPPKCRTKNGIFKVGKRNWCDLMFSHENEEFIQWVEELERYICNKIFENRESWFESEMELHDIENYVTSPLKIYKSGKFYLARTHIPSNLGKLSLNIYNEAEQPVDPESINEHSNIITILEVQGIKCSARSFQIEIEIKQMMLLNPTNLFDKCILKESTKKENVKLVVSSEDVSEEESFNESVNETSAGENIYIDTTIGGLLSETPSVEPHLENTESPLEESTNPVPEQHSPRGTEKNYNSFSSKNLMIEKGKELEFSEGLGDGEGEPEVPPIPEDMLCEIDFDLDKVAESEIIQIKPRNDVYYEMYKEAKRKARMARNLALSAYMEAKQIKDTYKLTDLTDSDDSDMEDPLSLKKEE